MNTYSIKIKLPFLYNAYLLLSQKKHDQNLIGKKVSFGEENPDKTFFIIKLNNPNLGLIALHNSILGYLRIADINGYIPIVDLKNYKNLYLENEDIGIKNAWEYYFEQPSDYTLNDVLRSKNVIYSSGISPREASPYVLNFLLHYTNKANYYFEIINKRIRIRDEIQQEIDNNFKNLIADKRVIGVLSRGSGLLNVSGHAIQPDIQTLIDKTKEMLIKWNCEYVYLSSEEDFVVEIFQKHFGNNLLKNNRVRLSAIDKKNSVSFDENDKYLKGIEYLTDIVILSKCNCLIGSIVGGSIGAIEMNQGRYEHKYLFNLVVYK